jgi:hypothetical protein
MFLKKQNKTMLYDDKDIPELNKLFHINDDTTKDYVYYQDQLLNKTVSPYIFGPSMMDGFLNRLNKLVSLFFDQFNMIKNWKSFTVDKYYYKQKN